MKKRTTRRTLDPAEAERLAEAATFHLRALILSLTALFGLADLEPEGKLDAAEEPKRPRPRAGAAKKTPNTRDLTPRRHR